MHTHSQAHTFMIIYYIPAHWVWIFDTGIWAKTLGGERQSCHFACLSVHAEARVHVCVCEGILLISRSLKARRLPQLNSVPITIPGSWGPDSLLACLKELTIGQADTLSDLHATHTHRGTEIYKFPGGSLKMNKFLTNLCCVLQYYHLHL